MPTARLRDRERVHNGPAPNIQIELGNKSLLGLFLALAVVCGMFFAFGYTLGKHAVPASFTLGSAPPAAAALPSAATPPPSGSSVQPPNPNELGQAESNQTPATLAPAAGETGAGSSAGTANAAAAPPSDAASSSKPQSSAPVQSPAQAQADASSALPAPGQPLYRVQVFAGAQADANSLAAALKSRGYPVSVAPPAAGDDLYRVQVGPYLTQDEAQAMRSRLTADGYQAILK